MNKPIIKERINNLIDPTAIFIKSVCKDARSRGAAIASEHFEGDVVMGEIMGEVFGDILSGGVICSLGNSLWDSEMG